MTSSSIFITGVLAASAGQAAFHHPGTAASAASGGAQLLGPHQVKAAAGAVTHSLAVPSPSPAHTGEPCTTPHLPSAVDPRCLLLSSLELSTNLHDVLQCPEIGPSPFQKYVSYY